MADSLEADHGVVRRGAGEVSAAVKQPAYSTEGFERFVVTVDDINTVFYSIGSGPDVVFLHGGGTFMGFEWARDLACDFRLLLPQHPNFGASSAANFSTTAAYAEHYAKVFSMLGPTQFHLCGASMGAAIAVDFAARYPDCVESLTLVTPAGLISPTVPPPDFTGVAPEDVPGYFVHDREFIEPYWPRDPAPEFAALLARERAAAAQLRDFTAEGDQRTRGQIAQIAAPTLLVWGDGDRVLRVGLLEQWRNAMPNAVVAVIGNGAHMLLEEFPAARIAVRDFLLNRS